jgi:hypothetical protein
MENSETEIADSKPGNSESGFPSVGIVEKSGVKRGRKPGSKNTPKILDTGEARKNFTSDNTPNDSVESAEFVAKGLVSLVELMESFVHSHCANKIEKRLPEKLGEFKEMALAMGLQNKEKDLIEKCTAKIVVRHDWLTKYAPELVLAVTMGQYSLRQLSLIKFVENVTKPKPQNPIVKSSEVQPVGQ